MEQFLDAIGFRQRGKVRQILPAKEVGVDLRRARNKNWHIRREFPDSSHCAKPIQKWHVRVRHNEIYDVLLHFEARDGLQSICGSHYFVTVIFKGRLSEFENDLFIFGEQNDLSMP